MKDGVKKLREELETAYQDVKSDYYGSTIARDVARQLADITGVGK